MNSDPVLYSEPEIVHCIHQGITCKNLQNKIYFSAWRLLLSLIGGGGGGGRATPLDWPLYISKFPQKIISVIGG